MEKYLITILSILLSLNTIIGQKIREEKNTGFGSNVSYTNFRPRGFDSGNLLGINIFFENKVEYGNNHYSSWKIGTQYSFGKSAIRNYLATSKYAAQEEITIEGRTKFNLIQLEFSFKAYLAKGNFDNGGFYTFAGISLMILNYETIYDYASYEPDDYELLQQGLYYTSKYFFALGGGLGYEFRTGFINPFIEGSASIPLVIPKSDSYLFLAIKFSIGARYSF